MIANSDIIKTFLFYDDKVIENKDNNSITRDKNAVIAEIRKNKSNGIITDYELNKTPNLNIYNIHQGNGIVTIHIKPNDAYNIFLKTILNKKNIALDEVSVVVGQDKYQISSLNSDIVKSGNNIDEMINYLHSMQNNDEIDHITKTGDNNLCYRFYTKDNEIIKLYADKNNKQIISKLDEFKPAVVKKKNIKKIFALAGLGVSLAVASPYIKSTVDYSLEKIQEGNETYNTFNEYMPRIESLHIRFSTGNISEDEILEYKTKTDYLINYIETNNIKDQSYESLLKYKEEVDNYYSNNIHSRHY